MKKRLGAMVCVLVLLSMLTVFTVACNNDGPGDTTPTAISITFNSNGGTGEMANLSATANQAVKLTANAFAKEGYTFVGWALTADGEMAVADGADFTGTANATLYAVWAIIYTINCDNDGAITTVKATYDTAFTCPVPTKTDYVFQGWYNGETQITDNLGASLVTFKDENGKVFNLTAKWALQTDGMEFSTDGTTLTKYTGTAQYVVIPDTVTSIGDRAFYDTKLTSITIPNTVTSIGDYAFLYCSGLTSITLPNSLKNIGYGAFFGCSKLTSIAIPANVTTIGANPFGMCSESTSITVDTNNTAYYSVDNCLINKSTKELISGFNNSVIPEGVISIGERAFQGCGLTSIIIPDSVTSIEQLAFSNCTGLTSIIIPSSVKSIGQQAFSRCSELTSITIPANVTSIGKLAFDSCTNLATINCEAANPGEGKLPAGWDANWKGSCKATVVWGYVAA